MDKLRPFQIALLAVFGVLGISSLVLLTSYQNLVGDKPSSYGDSVIIWGTLDNNIVEKTISAIAEDDNDYRVVEYFQKDPRTFVQELVNAIADGNQPDSIILPHDELVTLRTKLLPIPYSAISERDFRDTYVDGAEIFSRPDGIYAIPLAVDPLVMYWNRDLFSTAGLSLPPATWDKVTETVKLLTVKDTARNIIQSTVALGEYRNIQNAKAVLMMLLIQSGSRMVEERNNFYDVALNKPIINDERQPFVAAVQFYTEFSNASSPVHSWSRVASDDLRAFLGEELALYFGFGSEYPNIRAKNPNFNFDTTAVPQGSSVTISKNYGRFYGLAVVKNSTNVQGTYFAIQKLAASQNAGPLTANLNMAPALRSLLANRVADPYLQTIYNQALISHG